MTTQRRWKILSDKDKFLQLDGDPTSLSIKREDKVKTFLCMLKKNGMILELLCNKRFPSGSRPGILYGLPKVHKAGIPLRPILSSISTHAYVLAKFLVPLLRLFSSGNYLVSNSFSFVNDLFSSNFNSDNLIMASFDIKSLFTNMPLDETIDIIVTKLFSNSTHFHGFNSDDFTKLLQLSVKLSFFI